MGGPVPLEVVIDAFDDVWTLDPHRAFDTASRHPVLNLYDGLLGIDASDRIYPLLAAAEPVVTQRGAEWEVVIPIRETVTFHDGSALTVDDVVYSLRRMAITADGPSAFWSDVLLGAPQHRVDEAGAQEMARRVGPVSDGVLLRLACTFAPLEALLVQWSMVVNRSWCAAHGEWDGEPGSMLGHLRPAVTALDEQVNGTGPYTLDRWDRARRELVFRRRPDLREPEPRTPSRVILKSVDDRRERERQLLGGHCDFSVCQPESRQRLGEHEGVVLEKLPEEWSITPLGFITQRLNPECSAVGSRKWGSDGLPPEAFSDVHMRRMLSLSFDHHRYVAEVLDGEGLPHPAPFPAPAVPDVTAAIPVFDLMSARAEFERAWDGEPASNGCRITIYTHAANISRERAADILAEGLREVSPRIVVEVVAVDINALVELLYASSCPVAWAGWAGDFLHPYAFASAMLDPRAPLPSALGIAGEELIELVTQARNCGPQEAAAIYGRLAELAADAAMFLAPPGKVSYLTYSNRWQGVRLKHHVPNVLDFTSFRLRPSVQIGT